MCTLYSFIMYCISQRDLLTEGTYDFSLKKKTIKKTARKSMKFIVRLQFKSNSKFSSFSDSALTDDILSKVSLGFMRGCEGEREKGCLCVRDLQLTCCLFQLSNRSKTSTTRSSFSGESSSMGRFSTSEINSSFVSLPLLINNIHTIL